MKTQLNSAIKSVRREWIKQSFKAFIAKKEYPCMAARAALNHRAVHTFVAANLASPQDDQEILNALYKFIAKWRAAPDQLSSFVVIFEGPGNLSEEDFETQLWNRLECLHLRDSHQYDWNENISSDVTSDKFGLSLGGEGFFVIGMHAHSSRAARRFGKPALVFNLHAQFEMLRAKGQFDHFRDQTRKRDASFSGSVNPMVEDFGVSSEALQYSGRKVEKSHKCPFSAMLRKLGVA